MGFCSESVVVRVDEGEREEEGEEGYGCYEKLCNLQFVSWSLVFE